MNKNNKKKKNKGLTRLQSKILSDVDDEIYLIMKRIQLKHNLTWAKARDHVNKSIATLCCEPWKKRKI
tara:strand:+ start:686 stop:889 length:204 start_codon:yes stop_codon:yes gene_type:complete